MSSCLMFYDIVTNIIRNKRLEFHVEEYGSLLQILRAKIYMFTGGHIKNLLEERHIWVYRSSMYKFSY